MSQLRTLFFLAIGAFLFTGCATFGSVQRANTMGKGGLQVALEPGAKGIVGPGLAGGMPDVTVALRGGVSDRLDIGGRIGQNLWDLHMKYQFSDPEGSGPVVSLAPALSVYPLLALGTSGSAGGGIAAVINMPVLIGIPIGEHQFVFGPRIVDYFLTAGIGGNSGAVNILFAGSSFAFAVRAGEKFSIIPELTAVYPIVGGASANGETSGASLIGLQALMLEFKLGFQIGKQ